ncbi:tyrosine-protein phosphatase [Agromyces protaetiae]|uniref:tyrosine-protein phosphatase n=1 Tax=Agromyces protaetiae TaxID=2509455 RepID=UPI001FB752FB|nr:tyrosine-protein phosphatase [Agromyces protaetiae]
MRADDLTTTTTESADALVANGLRAVIDLRSYDEVAVTGRGPLALHGEVSYHHVPFMTSLGEATAHVDHEASAVETQDTSDVDPLDQPGFGGMYVRMYEGVASQIVTALAIIAHAPGTVAFHCAAGQDRTGVLAASLLLALGADHDDIVADYARTGENSAAIMERLAPVMAPLMAKFGFDLDEAARAATRTAFSDVPMRTLLAEMTARHGDPLAPLRAAGLTDALIERLRERAAA